MNIVPSKSRNKCLQLLVIIYACINISLACIGSFLPVILQSFGFSPLRTQALTIPVFVLGALSAVITSVISDRTNQKAYVVMACFVSMGVGWLLLLVSKSQNLSFAGCYFIALGTYPGIIISQTWLNINTPGFTRK